MTTDTEEIRGYYAMNSLCLVIKSKLPVFDKKTGKVAFRCSRDFVVFFHEYIHYLQNVSTAAGFQWLALHFSLMNPFSHSLLPHATGSSKGSQDLPPSESETVVHALGAISAMNGARIPLGLPSAIAKASVTGIDRHSRVLKWATGRLRVTTILMHLELELVDSTNRPAAFNLGTLAIEESVAHELDHHIKEAIPDDGSNLGRSPVLPYSALRLLGEYICETRLDRLQVAIVGVLALQTSMPAAAAADLFAALKEILPSTPSHAELVARLHAKVKPHIEESTKRILDSDVPELCRINAGREPIYRAVRDLGEIFSDLMNLRRSDPVFEISPFFSPSTAFEAVQAILARVPPADTIEIPADADADAGRAPIFGRLDTRPIAKKRTTGFRALQAQVHFLTAHSDAQRSLLRSSAEPESESECPFYAVCNLKIRGPNCRIRPWETFSRERPACWYGAAVACCMGTLRLRGSFEDDESQDGT